MTARDARTIAAPIDAQTTLMRAEAGEASEAVARFLKANGPTLIEVAARLRAHPPTVVVTCARGSSDHAATFGKYLIETRVGVVTASAAPSVASIFDAPPPPAGIQDARLCIAISQSGRSPDLLASVTAQRDAGAYVIALVNDAQSPLAQLADVALPLCAGPERSVAATKSYIVSLAALAALVAAWTEDADLTQAVATLPERLKEAFALDWSIACLSLVNASNLFVIGRGYGLGVAQEAALKLKETCGLHAECFSSAEVRHGPMTIVHSGFPVLGLAGSDEAGRDVVTTANLFTERDATVLLADCDGSGNLPALRGHPVIEPILLIQAFYPMVNALSVARGYNPDEPPFLNKVTRTV